ncbi:hypothetical protein [Tellurirhabdus bombi]|uniref:hypothetical protein n=1 Tax=Tellurirhabdus bombi TaxID=2907205 RepID=UPI001F418116|nr:hypothetical protein [Tellurirhabdus bombi]
MKKTYKPKLLSVDQTAGTVVLTTRAPDGTRIPISIDNKQYFGTAKDGQVWIKTVRPIIDTFSLNY